MRHERVLLLTLSILALVVAASLTMIGPSAASPEREGEVLTVHGEWSIRVLDSFGRVSNEVDFTNDLTPAGARTLTALLTGSARADDWAIRMGGSPARLCGESAAMCEVTVHADGDPDADRHPDADGDPDADGGLTVGSVADGSGFELSGSVEIRRDGTIDFVETHLSRCDASTGDCTTDEDTTLFTATGLDPVEVEDGQSVEIVVKISFD